jgi:hypothetical protein
MPFRRSSTLLSLFRREPRCGVALVLLAVCAVTFMPAVHGWTACHGQCHHHDGANVAACHCDHDGDPPEPNGPPHDPSSCDVCKQILIALPGVVPVMSVAPAPIGLLCLNKCALVPQMPASVERLDVTNSRGPPALA